MGDPTTQPNVTRPADLASASLRELSAINVDDTSRCPVGHRCESCGAERDDLAVETATATRLGVMCLTLCRRCASYDDQIPVSVSTAARLVGQHCQHLGIDLDEMAAAMEAGQ